MYCSYCGKQVQEDNQYCPFCGKPLPNTFQSSSAPASPQRLQPPPPTPAPALQRSGTSHTARNVAIIAVLAIVVIAIVVLVAFTVPGSVPGVGKPATVVVSGTVTTTGTGTSPQEITFTSLTNGETYVADANSGTYSISLPNGDSYSVTITWKFLGITGGTANAGTLNLDTTQSSITENWSG